MAASVGGAASGLGIAPAVPVPEGGPAEAPAPGQGGTRRVRWCLYVLCRFAPGHDGANVCHMKIGHACSRKQHGNVQVRTAKR